MPNPAKMHEKTLGRLIVVLCLLAFIGVERPKSDNSKLAISGSDPIHHEQPVVVTPKVGMAMKEMACIVPCSDVDRTRSDFLSGFSNRPEPPPPG